MKKILLLVLILMIALITTTACTSESATSIPVSKSVSAETTSNTFRISNPFDDSQIVSVEVLDCVIIDDLSDLEPGHFSDSSVDIVTDNGSLNPERAYSEDINPALVIVRQIVRNEGNEELLLYSNTASLATDTTSVGFKLIYFDHTTVDRDAKGFFTYSLQPGEEVQFSVGFGVGESSLSDVFFYRVNPFGVSPTDKSAADALHFVEMSL